MCVYHFVCSEMRLFWLALLFALWRTATTSSIVTKDSTVKVNEGETIELPCRVKDLGNVPPPQSRSSQLVPPDSDSESVVVTWSRGSDDIIYMDEEQTGNDGRFELHHRGDVRVAISS